MTISELIFMLKEIEKDHGDIQVKRPFMMDEYGDWDYDTITEAEYHSKKEIKYYEKESENNEKSDDYIVLW